MTSTHGEDTCSVSNDNIDYELSPDTALSIHVGEQMMSWAEQEVDEESNRSEDITAETRPFRPSRRTAGERREDAKPIPSRSSRRPSARAAPLRTLTTALTRKGNKLTTSGFRTGRLNASPLTITRAFVAIAPTAMVRIAVGDQLHLVRALIDSCAPISMIDARLAKKLQLERTGTKNNTKCTLALRGKYGVNQDVMTQATVVSGYTRLSPATSLDPSVATPFQFMKLADPQFHRSSPVRLTLGAEIYAHIMVSGSPPLTVGELLAQATIFGFVVSGAQQQ